MKKKLIMFDCFGVLMDTIVFKWSEEHSKEVDLNTIKTEYCHKADIGIYTFKELAAVVAKDYHMDAESVYNQWLSYFTVNEELIEIAKKLKEKYYVVLVSNAPEGEVEYAFRNYDFGDIFDKIYISYQYKCAKPDLEFYKFPVNDFACDDMVMIDDSPGNLKYLGELNVKSIVFKNNRQLLKELNDLGYSL